VSRRYAELPDETMAVDLHTLISHNKRASWLLAIAFVLFICALGAVFGNLWGLYVAGDTREEAYTYVLIGLAVALIVSLISTAGSYFGGASAILAMSRAKPITKQDDPQLFNVVEEMAIAAGAPMPRIYLIDDTAPNAFATGRDPDHGVIAVTTGLRQKLNRDELQGVIAHELSHIRNYDIRFAMLMATLVGVVVLLCDFFLRSLWWSGAGRSRQRRSQGRSGTGGAILLVLALILAIIAPLIAKLIQLAVSRQREYLADASAVELTRNPQGLAGALSKIASDKEVLEAANRATQHLYIVNPIKPFEQRAKSMFSTHPPIKERIRRILSLTVA